MLNRHDFRPSTGDGWRLDVTCYRDPDHFDAAQKPVVMIPGYGMNTFILNFHPTGESMVQHLCASGFEVWTANLRGQGDSKNVDATIKYGFRQLGLVDFPVVRDLVLGRTRTGARLIHVVGCSLGATVVYAYLAHHLDDHGLASMIAIGGPLRWEKVHPAVEMAFKSPALASLVPIRGTRTLARALLPVLKKMPSLLSIYMNTNQVDLSEADELVKTVDNPNPYLNHQIAKWVNKGDLMVAGVNVTDALAEMTPIPILCLLANRDGIVPPESAKSICQAVPASRTDVLEVGGPGDDWYAHADLFVSENARQTVFEPMSQWLLEVDDA